MPCQDIDDLGMDVDLPAICDETSHMVSENFMSGSGVLGCPPIGRGAAFNAAINSIVVEEDIDKSWQESLDKVDQAWGLEQKVYFKDAAAALSECVRHTGEQRAQKFMHDMLEHILEVVLEREWNEFKAGPCVEAIETIILMASNLISHAVLAGDASLIRCLHHLLQSHKPLFNKGSHMQCKAKEVMAPSISQALLALPLQDLLFSRLCSSEREMSDIVACCEMAPGSFVERLAERVEACLLETNVDNVVDRLLDRKNRQFNADGMERLYKAIDKCSVEQLNKTNEAWRRLAVDCCHSQKLLVRKAGLEIFISLAKIDPERTNVCFQEQIFPDVHGGNCLTLLGADPASVMEAETESVLMALTGERAHENLVDLFRSFLYTLERSRSGPADAKLYDCVLATCLGPNQHPTKEVRDAFRCAVAKLALTLTEGIEVSAPGLQKVEQKMEHRVDVATYIVDKVLEGLTHGVQGAAQLTLALFKEWDYDQISICMPSPKWLVQTPVWESFGALAQKTLTLLCAAFVSPELADSYEELRHSLVVCLQAGPSQARPGTREELAQDVRQIMVFCTKTLKALVSMYTLCLFQYSGHTACMYFPMHLGSCVSGDKFVCPRAWRL